MSKRPTSPHLQIYKWNISSLGSITHRLTGVMLYFSIVAISWYIVYYTYQINISGSVPSETCDCPMMKLIDQVFILSTICVIFALYYHFLNGIRHLFWDIGKGFEVKIAKITGYAVVIAALILTTITVTTVMYLKFF